MGLAGPGVAAKLWRVVALSTLDSSWLVRRVQFFTDAGCTMDATGWGQPSGSANETGLGPENAFVDGPSYWDSACGLSCCGAWLGIEFDGPQQVWCVRVEEAPVDGLPAVEGHRPPLGVEMLTEEGEWHFVASLPAGGGTLFSWEPQKVGALCQGNSAVDPNIRGSGETWVLTTYGTSMAGWAVQEWRLFSDTACTQEVTSLGIPLETAFFKEDWKAMSIAANATRAFDGSLDTAWRGTWKNDFWHGATGQESPLLGLALPPGVAVQCMRLDDEAATPTRLLRCSDASESWTGLDSCSCVATWPRGSNGYLPVQAYEPDLWPAICVLLCSAAVFGLFVLACVTERDVAGLFSAVVEEARRFVPLARGGGVLQAGDSDSQEVSTPLVDSQYSPRNMDDGNRSIIRTADLEPVKPAHEQFRERARETPHALCLRSTQGRSTYGEVAAKVEALAQELRSRIEERSVVALMLGRHQSMIVATMGVLEAGCCWVPLDERDPPERLQSKLQDCGAALLLADEGARWDLGVPVGTLAHDGAVVTLGFAGQPKGEGRRVPLPPADTACLYYTSGSTGEAKAVVLDQHFYTVVCAKWYCDAFEVEPTSVVAAKARFIWATALWEILPPLTVGGQILILPNLRTEEVARALYNGEATHLCGVPSELDLVIEPKLHLQHVICMGEKLIPSIANSLHEKLPPGCRLWNSYAATESAVTLWPVPPKTNRVLAGRPLQGSFVAIFTEDGEVAPVGEIGEIVMGGMVPKYGYWQRPQLTAEKFGESCVGVVYRTGDLGRAVPSTGGTGKGGSEKGGDRELLLEVVGRKDRQVKIRGQRVELGDVEAAAITVVAPRGGCAAAVAAAAEDGQQHLYVFAAPAKSLEPIDLRAEMQTKLPSYMVPEAHRVSVLDEMPRLPNGKVNFPELRTRASAMLAGEVQEALDSLGTARRYSQEQLSAKHSIETASGIFLLGMLLFHGRWWNWGITVSATCVGCTGDFVTRILQATLINESCLLGFVCGGALLASTQPDCFTFSNSDVAGLVIYLFMYFPWAFLLDAFRPFFPHLLGGRESLRVYHRWYLMVMVQAKVLLVYAARWRIPPSLVTAALTLAVICFPASGWLGVTIISGTCNAPGGPLAFLACWLFPGESLPGVVTRKWLIVLALYYAVVHYGPTLARCGGRLLPRPRQVQHQVLLAAAIAAPVLPLGLWYIGLVYPAEGYEVPEFPDAQPLVAFPRFNSFVAFKMLFLSMTVPVAQVAMFFAAVYYAPGLRVKRCLANGVSATMLGSYLISSMVNYKQWVVDVVLWVCPCQCSALQSVSQFLAACLVCLAIAVCLGWPFQIFLLRVVVPRTRSLALEAMEGVRQVLSEARGHQRGCVVHSPGPSVTDPV